MELFVENGYEETTVAQIADRAGLNRATFFRHFADKREVLFAGENVLADRFAEGIRAAAPGASLIACLRSAFTAASGAMTPHLRATAVRRRQVVAAHSDLQERARLKLGRIAVAIAGALRDRGTEELTARLTADMGLLAFSVAFERWLTAGDDEQFAPFAEQALADLQARVRELWPA